MSQVDLNKLLYDTVQSGKPFTKISIIINKKTYLLDKEILIAVSGLFRDLFELQSDMISYELTSDPFNDDVATDYLIKYIYNIKCDDREFDSHLVKFVIYCKFLQIKLDSDNINYNDSNIFGEIDKNKSFSTHKEYLLNQIKICRIMEEYLKKFGTNIGNFYVDARPTVNGKWIAADNDSVYYYCDNAAKLIFTVTGAYWKIANGLSRFIIKHTYGTQ